MKKTPSILNEIFITNYENYKYNYYLDYLTKFNVQKINKSFFCKKIALNFGFKDISFEKKQMILYFFLLELLTNQKCILTISKKNLINLKIKKGSIVGCKITLQNLNLFSFLETLVLCLPRSEVFKGFLFKKFFNKKMMFSTKLNNLFIFYMVESDVLNTIKNLDLTFVFNSFNDIEKCFFFTHNKILLNYNK